MKTKTWLVVLGICVLALIIFGFKAWQSGPKDNYSYRDYINQTRQVGYSEHQNTLLWNTCSNVSKGYSIKYPSDWTLYDGNYSEMTELPKLITNCDGKSIVMIETSIKNTSGHGLLFVDTYEQSDAARAKEDADADYSSPTPSKITSIQNGSRTYVLKFFNMNSTTTEDILSTLTFTK
jgi:hypothetical protein